MRVFRLKLTCVRMLHNPPTVYISSKHTLWTFMTFYGANMHSKDTADVLRIWGIFASDFQNQSGSNGSLTFCTHVPMPTIGIFAPVLRVTDGIILRIFCTTAQQAAHQEGGRGAWRPLLYLREGGVKRFCNCWSLHPWLFIKRGESVSG